MLCVQGFDYTFGNINPYLTSYLRNVTNGGVDYTNTLWLYQTKSISSCIALPLFGLFANRMSPRLFMFIGVLSTAAYMFGTSFGLKRSFWVMWFTYGIVGGVPGAFIYPTCLKISAGWVPEKRGLVMGINLMGYGVGSFMWNAMTTWYINGNNLQPDLHAGGDVYYTQSEVLDKVPSCFLVLGAVFICMQLVCLVLIRIPQSCQVRTITLSSVNDTEREISSDSQEHEPFLERPQTPDEEEEGGGKQEYHWKQVLKSRVFWTVWWMLLFSAIGVAFVIPLFKAFGQTFIADDHFLATVAMFSSICNAAGRPFWGLLADRFGPRIVALVVQSILAILVVTFTSCREMGQVAFFFWVCAMFFTMCGFFTMIPIITLAAFGPHYFNVNMGLVDSNGIIGAIIPALIAPYLKSAFGWNGLFCVGFAGLFTGILLNISLDMFKCGNSIPRHMFSDLSIRRSRAK
ncbi:oxalate:formate antiporter-like [Littorina saxatilis]